MCWRVRNFLGSNNGISGFVRFVFMHDSSLKYCFFFWKTCLCLSFVPMQRRVFCSCLFDATAVAVVIYIGLAHFPLNSQCVFECVARHDSLAMHLVVFFPSRNVCKCDKITMSHKEHPNKGTAKRAAKRQDAVMENKPFNFWASFLPCVWSSVTFLSHFFKHIFLFVFISISLYWYSFSEKCVCVCMFFFGGVECSFALLVDY